MSFIKKEIIILPQKELSWMQSHAMLPTVVHLEEDLFRVYFSGRDTENRSLIGYANVEVKNGKINVLDYSKEPVLLTGERGCFDDNGVTPSCIIKMKDQWYMYYIGWNSGTSTTRVGLIAGLAISNDAGKTFKRNSRSALLEKTDREPFSILTAPYVIHDEVSNKWEMWYVSCEGWRSKDLPTYNIKYASSKDGVNWDRDGHICIDFIDENETALARPCVRIENGIYKMWFSYKDPRIGYRIGYAESLNGKDWNRSNEAIDLSVGEPGEWDSDMIEYSFVFEHKGVKYMFYNGNGYGQNGAGYAVYKSEE